MSCFLLFLTSALCSYLCPFQSVLHMLLGGSFLKCGSCQTPKSSLYSLNNFKSLLWKEGPVWPAGSLRPQPHGLPPPGHSARLPPWCSLRAWAAPLLWSTLPPSHRCKLSSSTGPLWPPCLKQVLSSTFFLYLMSCFLHNKIMGGLLVSLVFPLPFSL